MEEPVLAKNDLLNVFKCHIGDVILSKLDDELLDWTMEMIATELEDHPSCSTAHLEDRLGVFLGDQGLALARYGGPSNIELFNFIKEDLAEQLDKILQSQSAEKFADGDVDMGELMAESSKFVDPFLGIDPEASGVNYNVQTSINELLAERKQRQRERDRALKAMKEWQQQKVPWPSPMKLHANEDKRAALKDVIVERFSLGIGGQELLLDADLRIVLGRKYGLIGRNGIGKSTLLGALVRKELRGIEKQINFACIEQEVDWIEGETPLDAVLRVDKERNELLAEVAQYEANDKHSGNSSELRIAWIYDRLEEIEADKAPIFAISLLHGLGLSDLMIKSPITSLSGGWRMRVALARGLFAEADVLLLDEPTNHLDLHAVAWLTSYLTKWNKTCIVVSHAREFLNDICSDMIEFKDMKLNYYKGNFDIFERTSTEKEKLHEKQFESQQKYIKEQEKFINRFRAKANLAKTVQSRIKMLARLPKLDAVKKDPALVFNFVEPGPVDGTFLSIQDGKAIYPSDPNKREVLSGVDFHIDKDSRIAVCGCNGSGKSTLLKMLVGDLGVSGVDAIFHRNENLIIGYFGQHHVDALDMSLNAVSSLIMRYASDDKPINELQARSYLGRFGITGSLALEPLFILSGGQKSRVALALMAYAEPHLLILDEPTNHLDLEAVQALIGALNEFEGGVVIVSHDSFMLTCVVDEVYHVEPTDGSVTKFRGNFDLYKQLLLRGGPSCNPIEMSKDAALVARLEVQG